MTTTTKTPETMSAPATELPPPLQLLNMITAPWVTQSLYVVCKMGVPDLLKEGTKSSAALAKATGAHEPSLFRVLRALSSIGVFEEKETRHFALGPLGQFLRKDVRGSMRNMALFQGAPDHHKGWTGLLHAVRTGKSGFTHVHGENIFERFKKDKEYSEAFNGAMTELSQMEAALILEAYDFAEIKQLADIGGGHGYLMAEILKKNPSMRGIVSDLGHVLEGSKEPLKRAGLADRCNVVEGDFFKAVPAAENYITKHIMHDWDDEGCVKILNCMKRAMVGTGKILIADSVIPPGNEPAWPKLLDLEMLNSCDGGKERTESEFEALLKAVDFRLERVVQTSGDIALIEGVSA